MTDHIYGEESIKIKQAAKTDWVQSEFREQERYRRNYYGTIFLEILLEKMQRKEDVLYIETVRAPRVVRVKRRKKDPGTKKCGVAEKQSEPVIRSCDDHKPKETDVPGVRSVLSAQKVQDMQAVPEISLPYETAGQLQCSGETILVWASGDILELSVMSELPEISGNYNARACMV